MFSIANQNKNDIQSDCTRKILKNTSHYGKAVSPTPDSAPFQTHLDHVA